MSPAITYELLTVVVMTFGVMLFVVDVDPLLTAPTTVDPMEIAPD